MSTFTVPVVRIGYIFKHPNADTLSVTEVEGCPVVFRTGDFKEGDLAVYIPVESVVPPTVPGTEFLGDHRRIKAKKLRGVFSMGLLLPTTCLPVRALDDEGWPLGRKEWPDVASVLNITKYEEPEPIQTHTETAPGPKLPVECPKYDVEHYRKYKHVLTPGESIIITEKIHGTNSRFVYDGTQLHVGSHTQWKKDTETCLWWKVARRFNVAEKLQRCPVNNLVFYGETYGQVQDLKYGAKPGELSLAIFDIFDANDGRWLDYKEVEDICEVLDLPMVPVLYSGEYTPNIENLCDGNTWVAPVKQIREGIVIRPMLERNNRECGRVVLKLLSEAYLTRRGGTEHH